LQATSKSLKPFVAAVLKQRRKEKGWTQEKLALEVGVSSSEISHNESGRRDPKLGTLERLAEALGISCRELIKLAEELRAAEQEEDLDT
jgi:transcriptional regulator with XRE-family HTH domain